jgi:hypothetical protein
VHLLEMLGQLTVFGQTTDLRGRPLGRSFEVELPLTRIGRRESRPDAGMVVERHWG